MHLTHHDQPRLLICQGTRSFINFSRAIDIVGMTGIAYKIPLWHHQDNRYHKHYRHHKHDSIITLGTVSILGTMGTMDIHMNHRRVKQYRTLGIKEIVSTTITFRTMGTLDVIVLLMATSISGTMAIIGTVSAIDTYHKHFLATWDRQTSVS